MPNGAYHVVERDPTQVLGAVADYAAEPEPERQQHLFERAAVWAEHDADSQPNDARPGRGEGLHRGFPFAAHVGQKPGARRALFGQHLVLAVAVVADGRGAQKHRGRPCALRQDLAQPARPDDAAVPDAALEIIGPPPGGDILAGQMNHGIEPLERIGAHVTGLRVPDDSCVVPDGSLRVGRLCTYQAHDTMTACGQQRHQRRAYQAAGAGYENAHESSSVRQVSGSVCA